MADMTHSIPTPATYDEYIRQRNERTEKAMSVMNTITGSFIKQNNLSVRMLFDNGYTFDSINDTMVKE